MKTKKKGLYQKWNTFFAPISSGHLRSYVHQSQIIGGDADETILKLLGGYIPPSPPRFRHPCLSVFSVDYMKITNVF